MNHLVDNVLENDKIRNSNAGLAIDLGRKYANAGFIKDDQARYEAMRDISHKAMSSW